MSLLSALWGKSSWFGGPNDPSSGSQTASGAPVSQPGIAVYNRATLGGWWAIKAPNGSIGIVQQTDIGPAPRTGRKFDYTFGLLPLFGYTERTFPTDGQTYGFYLGKTLTDVATNDAAALKKLGATTNQEISLAHAVDVGAIMRGHTVVFGPDGKEHAAPGVSTATGSSAVAANIIPSPSVPDVAGALSNIFNTAIGDAKYAAVLVVAVVLGAALMLHGLRGGSSPRAVPA